MIVAYYRPENIADALELLQKEDHLAVPLGGGSVLCRPGGEPVAVVDLQNLGLNIVMNKGSILEIGATATLQQLLETNGIHPALTKAIRHEATYNLRQVATVAGAIVASDGRAPFATTMLALDAQLTLQPDNERIGLGDLLPLRGEKLAGRLITAIAIPLNVKLGYEYVARSPADQPIVAVAVALWQSRRMRVALGGFGSAPILAMDGKADDDKAQTAIENSFLLATDQWATAEYRVHAAQKLVRRSFENANVQ